MDARRRTLLLPRTNRLYSTYLLTDATGAIAERCSYTAYGAATTYDSSYTTPQSTSRVGNPYLFSGRELDGETLLYNYRARPYDAIQEAGRLNQLRIRLRVGVRERRIAYPAQSGPSEYLDLRKYHPTLEALANPDNAGGELPDQNRYQYCGGSPTNCTGLEPARFFEWYRHFWDWVFGNTPKCPPPSATPNAPTRAIAAEGAASV